MFRPLVIAAMLLGMTMCQVRCMGAGRSAAEKGSSITAQACRCCRPPVGAPGDGAEEPHPPADGGECGCQGLCGGAVVPDAVSPDGLLLAWSILSLSAPTPQAVDASAAAQDGLGGDVGPAAPDGRAVRVRIASLQV